MTSHETYDSVRSLKLAQPMSMRWGWLNWQATARRAITLLFFALVNYLLLAPAKAFKDVHILLSHQDKIAHFLIFCTLTGMVRWSIPATWGRGWKRGLFILTLVAYGAGIECIQPLMPGAGRTFEWMDLLLDCIGVVMGKWLCERLARKEENAEVIQ